MPHAALKLVPGVDTARTPTLLEAGFQSASNIRFNKDGLPEKLGGWDRFFASALSGTPRALHAWQTIDDTRRLAIATTGEVSVIADTVKQNITPQIFISNVEVDFTTSSGSAIVSIVDDNLTGDVTTYDVVNIVTPVSIDGLVLYGIYPIIARLSGTSFTIQASSNALAGVSNGGAVPVFDTTANSDRVEVSLDNHGLVPGDTYKLPIPVSVGGVTLPDGVYQVTSAPDPDTFTIIAPQAATSAATSSLNGGDVRIEYYIAIGPDIVTGAGIGMIGFGALGEYALGDGSESEGISIIQQEGDPIAASDWTIENWGDIILASPCHGCDVQYGGIWYWWPGRGFQTMRMVDTAPLYNTGIFLSQPAQILVAYGSTANEGLGVSHDPLLVRWSHQQDFTVWSATATNYAGSYRIPSGSRIVGGLSTRQTDLLWTDIDLWSMKYVGGQGNIAGISLVYVFNKIGTSCGLIAKHAAVTFRNVVYWMNRSNFFRLGGNGPEVLPCTVWDAVFQDIDEGNLHKCWAVGNTKHDEVWFFYPSASGGSGECDRYAKINVLTGAWDHGPKSTDTPLSRSAGIDQSVLGTPILASPSGMVYQHEKGYAADGAPLRWSWKTGYFELAEGAQMSFMDWLLPDFKYGTFGGASNAALTVTLHGIDYQSDTPVEYGPYPVTSATPWVDLRVRNRLISVEVSGSDTEFSRLGQIRLRYQPDGRR